MQLAIAIVSAVVTIAGLVYKIWKQRQDSLSLQAEVTKETLRANAALLALDRARAAGKERSEYVSSMEASFKAHLKVCGTPLASWANELMQSGDKDGKDSP